MFFTWWSQSKGCKILKWVTRGGVTMLLLKSFPKLHYLHIHLGLGRTQACLKAKKWVNLYLKVPLVSYPFSLCKCLRWTGHFSGSLKMPDQISLLLRIHGLILEGPALKLVSETYLVIIAATETLFALHSFLDPLGSKNASLWLLGNYCWIHARGINCVNIF